jgi:hypothetical protein
MRWCDHLFRYTSASIFTLAAKLSTLCFVITGSVYLVMHDPQAIMTLAGLQPAICKNVENTVADKG